MFPLSLRLEREPPITEVLQNHFHPGTIDFIYKNTSGDEHLYTYKLDDTIVKITHDSFASDRLATELVNYTSLYAVLTPEEMKYFIPNVSGGSFVYGGYTYTFLKMSYIKSVDLLTFIQSKPEQKMIYKILKEIAIGLLILSKHGFSHGDMHSGNVLIIGHTIKIIDFDSAGKSQGAMNRNFKETGGFFMMCLSLITDPSLQKKINDIRLTYTHSSSSAQSAFEAFIALMGSMQGGRRTATRKRSKRIMKRRTTLISRP